MRAKGIYSSPLIRTGFARLRLRGIWFTSAIHLILAADF
jgi:hypothetical protein